MSDDTGKKPDDGGDDDLGELEDWDALFDTLHEPDSAEAEKLLEEARERDRALTAGGAHVLDVSQFALESDAGLEVEIETTSPEPPPAAQAEAKEPEPAAEDATPIPGEAPGTEPLAPVLDAQAPALDAQIDRATQLAALADPIPTLAGAAPGSSQPDPSEVSEPPPAPFSSDAVDDLDAFLDFDEGAHALGDLLGAPPPLPPPSSDESIVKALPESTPPPFASADPAADTESDGDGDEELYTSAVKPTLPAAPTDEELFGDLPDELPEDVAPAVGATPYAESTRIADAAVLDEMARASSEAHEIDQVESAQPSQARAPEREAPRGPAIVRREDLERKRRAAEDGDAELGDGDFGGGESTRIADIAALDDLVESEARAAQAAAEAAEAFFNEEAASLELELDDDFYDDIEIGADQVGSTEVSVVSVVPEAPSAAPSGESPRRTTAHIVRRASTEAPVPAADAPVVVLEAEFADEAPPAERAAVVTGSLDNAAARALADDEILSSAPPLFASPSPEPEPIPSEALRDAAAESQEREALGEADTDSADAESKQGESQDSEALGEAAAEPTAAQPEPSLTEIDVAPELPPGIFTAELPTLDLDALRVPAQAEAAITDLTETWAAQLLVYEREIETLDDPAALARLRVEAGRLSERLGDSDRARIHYEEALVADPRLVPAMRGLRRVERVSGRWHEAVTALDAQLPFASKMERRALAAHRADLLMAAGEQDLARVAVGELLDEAPGDVRSLLANLELAFVDGRDEELVPCLDRLAKALEDQSLGASLAELRGRLASRAGDTATADEAFRAAHNARPDAGGWAALRTALAGGDSGRVAVALDGLTAPARAERDAPIVAALLRRQAVAIAAGGNAAAAHAALASAAAFTPEDPTIATDLAVSSELRGDAESAARAWLAATNHLGDDLVRAAAYRRAARHLASISPADALEALRRGLELDPSDVASSAALEALLEAAGQREELVALETRALGAAPRDLRVREQLALRLATMRRAADAAAIARAGVGAMIEGQGEGEGADEADESTSIAVDLLARALAQAGDHIARAELLSRAAARELPGVHPAQGWRRAARAAEEVALAALAEHASADAAAPNTGPDGAESHAASARNVATRLHAALEMWQNVLDLDPEARSAHAASTRIAQALDDPDLLERTLLVAQAAEAHPAGVVGIALRRVALLLGRAEPDVSGAEDVLREADALAPGDPRAALPLMILGAGAQRWADAAQVLEERAAQLGESPEAHALRFRAAAMYLDRADEPARAAELVTPVIEAYPGFGAAADLQVAAHRRLGDAGALAADFDRASAVGSDVEGARGDRFALLVREAELYEYRVGDPGKAVDVYSKALELRPNDPLARGGFVRAAAAAGEAAPVAELALADLKHAEEIGDAAAKADAYEELARVDAELRGDPASALFSWESAAGADPGRHTALRVLERTYAMEQRDEDLLALYGRQLNALGASTDAVGLAVARARLAETLGRSSAEVLANYRRAFEADPRCRVALFRLEADQRTRGLTEELAELEHAIADYFADEPVARASFLTRAGETLASAGKLDRAIESLRAAAELVEGGHAPALAAWRRAALQGELWLDVAEAARREAAVAVTDSERVALLHLAGVTLMDKALNGERAIDVLRGVIAIGGAGPSPIVDDAFVRLRILFEEMGQHEDLAQLLAARLEVETNEVAKVEILHALADLHRNFLDDRDKAADYLRAITEVDPGNRAAVAALSDIAWEKGEWAAAAEALILRARIETDPQVLKHVFYRLGTIYSDRIPDHRWALRSFQRVLAFDPEDRGALEKLSELSVLTGDWKNALAACERLIKGAFDPLETIPYWHRVATIYIEGFDNRPRAEQALRRALDVDPTNAKALEALVGFYQQAGDTRSMRVHLDRVAAQMRARVGERLLDPMAFRVLSRVLESREQAGVKGSIATARCAAEVAQLLGAAEERENRLVAHAAQVKPPIAALGKTGVDEYLFPRAVTTELRQIATAIGDRLAKHAGIDVKRYGVGRAERVRGGAADVLAEMAQEMGADGVELYVSTKHPRVLGVEPTSPVSIVIGAELMESLQPPGLRFVGARALKLSMASLAVFTRMDADEAGVLLAGLVRQFQPDFAFRGINPEHAEAEAQRMRRLLPSGLQQELRPFALGLAGARLDHRAVLAGIMGAGSRAGLLAAGSVAAAVRVMAQIAGHPDLRAAAGDPSIAELIRFSVSEEHALLRGMLGG